MRILLAPAGSRGDVQPFVTLATALMREGARPILCGAKRFRAEAEERAIPFVDYRFDVEAAMRARGGDNVAGRLATMRVVNDLLLGSVDCHFDTLLEASSGGVDLVVGAGLQVAGAAIAAYRRVPYVCVAYCPAAIPSRSHAPMTLPFPNLPRPLVPLAWRATELAFRHLLGGAINARRAGLGLPPMGDVLEAYISPQPVLATDPELGEAPRDPFGARALQLGYMHRGDAPRELPEPVERFLGEGPPPVYIGFGSMVDPEPDRTARMIVEAVERAGCRAIVAHGWAGLHMPNPPPRVLFADELPHEQLFPRCAMTVHHGGAGTTHASARAGVPQLLVPHMSDQFFWSAEIARRGLGPAGIPRAQLDARGLARAIRTTLATPALAEGARRLGETLRRRDAATAVAQHLVDLARRRSPRSVAPSAPVRSARP